MQKVALVAFQGEMMCFVHVLLNALDMHAKGMEPAVVFEGAAVKLAPELAKADNPFHALYEKTREAGLIAGVCKACSAKMGVLEEVKGTGLNLLDGMQGHPSLGGFLERGYTIMTF